MPSVERGKELNDLLWARARPLLPAHAPRPKGGRPPADGRACFEAIVFVLRSGLRRRDLPDRFPSPATCWRRHADWTGDGVWEEVRRAAVDALAAAGSLDTSELYLDGAFAPAQRGGRRSGAPSAARG
jgi:transposase